MKTLPKCLVTGGLAGIGKDIVDYFEGSTGVSKRNGYDIREKEARNKIVKESLNYDIFVNLAHDGEFAQSKLLYEIFATWERYNKIGLIVNIGSIATYDIQGYKRFSVLKYFLDVASKQCSKKIASEGLPFRCSIIRPGLLDLEKSRKKDKWKKNGVRGKSIAQTIEYIYNLGPDQQINDLVINSTQI